MDSFIFNNGNVKSQEKSFSYQINELILLPVLQQRCGPDLKIEFPKGKSRVREVVRKSNFKSSGKYPSPKNGRQMHWESPIERSAFMILNVHSKVIRYFEQPAIIHYQLNGISRTHIPDTLVELSTGHKVFIEYKDDLNAQDSFFQERTALLKAQLPFSGYYYLLISPKNIPQIELDNAKRIGRYSQKLPCRYEVEKLRRHFSQTPIMSISEVTQILKSYGKVLGLICHNILTCEMDVPITHATLLIWNVGGSQ